MKILIVEDELIIAEYMKGILEDVGHEVLPPVRNYIDAIDSFNKNNPNLVLLDIRLADEDSGFKVAQKIKEGSNTAIVLVSGNTSKEFVEEAKELNPNGFLSKPVKPIDLLLAVELAYNSFVKNAKMTNDIANLASQSLLGEQTFLLKSFIHDMMNPVSSIQYELKKNESLKEDEKASLVDRFSLILDLLKSFRTVIKESNPKAETLSVASICKKVDLINRYRCISNSIDLMITPIDGFIEGSESSLIRIFSNLINNSIDALSCIDDDDKWIEVVFTKVGNKTRAVVTDSGNGIASDIAKNLFTESFSTKEEGDRAGMGLGLYSAKEALTSYGHDIHYNSKATNTQFIIDFNVQE